MAWVRVRSREQVRALGAFGQAWLGGLGLDGGRWGGLGLLGLAAWGGVGCNRGVGRVQAPRESSPIRPALSGARPAAGVERGGDRSAGPGGGRARRAVRGGCLHEVGKLSPRREELAAVMAPYVGPVPLQGVQEPGRVDLGHPLGLRRA